MAGEQDGPNESYRENGQLEQKGTYNMGEQCGEWIEDGETVTYDPCPPDLADGNWPSLRGPSHTQLSSPPVPGGTPFSPPHPLH